MNGGVAMRGWRRTSGALIALLITTGCGMKTRLDGPNYGGTSPFQAPSSEAWKAAGPPDQDLRRPDGLVHRVILIGDTGKPAVDEPTLRALGEWGDPQAERTTVLFLGDNLYESGLEDDDRERGEAVLLQQLTATRAHKIFVPGNHDWGGFDPTRVGVVRNQQEFVEAFTDSPASFMPSAGCPGPVVHTLADPSSPLGRGVDVILLDTHWWLLPEELGRPECDGPDTKAEVLEALRAELEKRRGRFVIVGAHHPLRSGGPHGGMSRGFIGDRVEDLILAIFGSLQDIQEPSYQELVTEISQVLRENPPLIHAGGHDHNLQVIDGGDVARLLIVSGAGSTAKVSPVTAIEGTLFAHAQSGFIVVDFRRYAGETLVEVRAIEPTHPTPLFQTPAHP